jgi:hypothetical protein
LQEKTQKSAHRANPNHNIFKEGIFLELLHLIYALWAVFLNKSTSRWLNLWIPVKSWYNTKRRINAVYGDCMRPRAIDVKPAGLSIEWLYGQDICPDELYYNSTHAGTEIY